MPGVAEWFAKRGELPLVRPASFREYTPLDDDPDSRRDCTEQRIRGVAFGLEYCDSRGWASTRMVRCLAVDPVHPACLSAYCSVRQAPRTFRIDRIISIADLRTGRILSGHEQMALLSSYLRGSPDSEEFAALADVQEVTRDGVFALLQLAMPDGRLSAAARSTVISYVKAEADATRTVLAPSGDIEVWIDNLLPPLGGVLDSVTALLTDKDRFARLLPWLLKVMRSRDTFADEEEDVRELIAEVRRHFRRQLFAWPSELRATR